MCGCALKPNFATAPTRSIIRANPAGLNGAPRSDVNTNGDLDSCNRQRMIDESVKWLITKQPKGEAVTQRLLQT